MTDRDRYAERAEQLLLRAPVRAAWLLLNLHADEEGCCPACQSRVDRYEASRCTHARLCSRLHALAAGRPTCWYCDGRLGADGVCVPCSDPASVQAALAADDQAADQEARARMRAAWEPDGGDQ